MPDYQKRALQHNRGDHYSINAGLQRLQITITLKYVNPATDPIKTVELKAKVGSVTYATIQTFDATSDAKDTEVTRAVTYTTPNVAGTVTFDMVITSQMPYPQVKRASVAVQ